MAHQRLHCGSDQEEEPLMDVTRRNLLQIIGAAPAVAAAEQELHQHTPPAASAAKQGGYQRKVFDEKQWRTVKALCDLIIPADERSGSASAAGVPEFIDDWLDFRKQEDGDTNFMAQILGGLVWLDRESMHLFAKNFADTAADQQKQILDRIAWPERA